MDFGQFATNERVAVAYLPPKVSLDLLEANGNTLAWSWDGTIRFRQGTLIQYKQIAMTVSEAIGSFGSPHECNRPDGPY